MADMSQRTQQAVDTARETVMAGAAEAGRVGRRIVKMIWDPQPVNDRTTNRPVWCLGCPYTHDCPARKEAALEAAAPSDATPPTTPSVGAEVRLTVTSVNFWLASQTTRGPLILSTTSALASSNEPSLRVYSTGDLPDVYEDSFMAIAKPDGETFHPTLILVGTRLGIDKINQVYWESLTATLQLPQSVGIAGGRPSQSHYFVGAQQAGDNSEPGSYLFYLDPHFTRPALPFYEDVEKYSKEDIDSCHTRRLRRLHVREMDPSMLIGFLIRDEDDWDAWKDSVKYVQGKAVIRVSEHDPARGLPMEREGAIDEVETLSDDDDDDSTLDT
ncbi:putative cysteine protease atg4 [Diaporthe ampelina]|uniref:Cysteine protease n=1 Tax=Diaporthe ampelina TaxID=1214573 RepID=A0A0G2FMU9_9PEZI|nr:putative cysteine protease atg4 [Diaporthe ampelina]